MCNVASIFYEQLLWIYWGVKTRGDMLLKKMFYLFPVQERFKSGEMGKLFSYEEKSIYLKGLLSCMTDFFMMLYQYH